MTERRTRRWLSAPPRPALPYYGSKWRLSTWIRDFIPDRHDVYCEPFGGSAGVLLRKPPARLDVYNDLDAQVVNFFRVLRDDTTRERLINLLQLSPYAKSDFEEACRTSADPSFDPVEQARLLFVRGWQGYGPGGASTDRAVGWARGTPSSLTDQVRSWLGAIPNLDFVAERMRTVQIEHDTAWSVMERYDSPETVFYVDPPYVRSTLSAGKGYRHDFADADHHRLAELLDSRQGMVILSGFDSPLYQELFGHWDRREKQALTVGRSAAGRVHRTEVVWLNAAVVRRLAQESEEEKRGGFDLQRALRRAVRAGQT